MPAAALKEENSSKIASLTPELKETLHQSLLHYLHRNGFSKTLKRFQSEAQIQSDAWKASSLDLEDIFSKYNACNVDSNLNTSKKLVLGNEETTKKESEIATNEETTTKKKMKKGAIATKNEIEPSTTNENEVITEVEKKEKKKKKKKSKADSANEDDQVKPVKEETENKTVEADASKEEKKSSKKRKRSLADENENDKEVTIAEESKGQKNETSNEKHNVEENGKVEINGGETSGGQNSSKRQRKDSTEPKTVNAFQRVKIDQVEFAHEKLQDNSYWAKDGADIGYGAKAQEVLGQVRGRDFRHEKTKKKRGSYRGGLIDLQSHSIKFNYSDEE